MNIKTFFKIGLRDVPCVAGLSEDSLRQLVEAIEITVADTNFSGFVQSTYGTNVKFTFGSDGNFSGVYAKLGSKTVPLINGVGSKELSVFKGPPSNSNPGAGWTIEPDLTKKYLGQDNNENTWEIFFASRSAVI